MNEHKIQYLLELMEKYKDYPLYLHLNINGQYLIIIISGSSETIFRETYKHQVNKQLFTEYSSQNELFQYLKDSSISWLGVEFHPEYFGISWDKLQWLTLDKD